MPTNRRLPRRRDVAATASVTTGRSHLVVKGARQNNLQEHRRRVPARRVRRRHRRQRLRQELAGQRSALQHARPQAAPRAHPCGGSRRDPRPRSDRQGHQRRSGSDRQLAALESGDLHRRLRSDPRNCSPSCPKSKVRGYQPQRFSFNKPGGRCEACEGNGQKKIEMHFLPDVWVECDVCHGSRYNPETLGRAATRASRIADVLDHARQRGPGAVRQHSEDSPRSANAGRRRPRLSRRWASRPRRCPAARRSASSWPPSWRGPAPAGRSTCSTSRRPGCTSTTSASCSKCSTASSIWATRSSSSSTIST